MSSAQDRSAINRMLMAHGLGRLEDGKGLLSQLGFLVQDHEHLRSLLARCEPENRSDMYNSLTPYLRFQAKPLDTYIAESAQRAEAQQLPTIDEKGELSWPKPDPSPEDIAAAQRSTADLFAAQNGVNEAMAKKRLLLVCEKCTREAVFTGDTKADALLNARLAGWAYWERGEGQNPGEICPECPAVRLVH